MEFRTALDALCEEEFLRTNNPSLWTDLVSSELTPEHIDKAVCAELVRVCTLTYETPGTSDRLNRYGWSSIKIQEHMRRYLRHKIQDMCAVLRAGNK